MGAEYPLKHGYYCVRLPDDDERSQAMTRADYQRLADQFFNATSPWKDILHSQRFGVPNFVSDISKLLVGLIETKHVPSLWNLLELIFLL